MSIIMTGRTFEDNRRRGIPNTYSTIKAGSKKLEDAVLDMNYYKKIDSNLGDKGKVMRAIYQKDIPTCRAISNFFFRVSGIYARLCKYMANMYRYDWLVTPYISDENYSIDKTKKTFNQVLMVLDKFNVKKHLGQIALDVIRDGCWYGYIFRNKDNYVALQELPIEYCRSRFFVEDRPAVEMNMKFFDDYFRTTEERVRALKIFGKDFQRGYKLYKDGKLKPDSMGDSDGWYMLDTENSIKFNISDDDLPLFMAVIPAIIDLAEGQGINRQKMAQELAKLVIQQLPLDKNGETIFDPEEIAEFHNNAVQMLSQTIGVEVLTTLATTKVEGITDSNTKTTTDDLEKLEREVFNEAGVSQLQFNSTGNIALNNSILNDEASLYNLILKFQDFLNQIIKPFNKTPKKIEFKTQVLSTTIYNYKEMSKLYKEQMQVGYSKMLAQIALGQSQSSILANAHFENDILELFYVFIPPLMSSTMSSDILNTKMWGDKQGGGGTTAQRESAPSSDNKGGRPELEENQKSDKTLKNQAAG